ncbi:hypothetical protein BD626DRAFT_167509 [Schizophyllum amplum]|uniref:C3H1-type domain-containing protein n=1 Tax=Schizophyllum amplum TaxID=97359 RepID=A0A550CQA9_9AGAR|nr:hypothetical protein BD626DRAFT_167509 [Auriculariopsis ampla]
MYAYTGHNGKKRRQVVPCDYWIRGGCPRSAAKCDFAHSFPNQVRPGYCRYYAMGRCVHGMRCKFKHELPEDPQLPAQWNSPPPSAHPAMIYPATPPSAPSVMPLMTPPQMASPLYMMTPPQMMTPASSISSMSSLTYSPSTATTASDDMPWWNDEPEQCDDVSVAVAAVDEFGVRMPTTQPVPAVTKPRRTKYKSMLCSFCVPLTASDRLTANPCVFFLSTSGCSRGDSCTFLHGGEVAQVPSPELPVHALPAKPSSAPKQESQEDRKREYYPVTWRVISGGTRLGRTSTCRPHLLQTRH